MEVDGMLRIFNRSEKLHNLKYSNYIGDGDTKTFNALSENKPYGDDYLIQKIECVGHVQKRMGRLTDSLIDKLAHYYGNAIRCNSTSVKEIRKAIWAVWGHSCSTDDEPMHWFCPTNPNTWCKALNTGSSHKNTIVITAEIEPGYFAKDDMVQFHCIPVSSSVAPLHTEASWMGVCSTRNGRSDPKCPSARHLRMIREYTSASSKGATCVWRAADVEFG
ncbi:uncharacterized protein TNCV_498071 [Trichonephila clavipes]|nr:uncharacterized protein TNCV_498071 [Trichonephila clavipes]